MHVSVSESGNGVKYKYGKIKNKENIIHIYMYIQTEIHGWYKVICTDFKFMDIKVLMSVFFKYFTIKS